MPVFVDPPPFPVIQPHPSVRQLFAAFRPSDWAIAAGWTAAGFAWGFSCGRYNWARLFAASGLAAGLNLGLVASAFRLTGYEHNEVELKAYGPWRPPPAVPPPAPASSALAPVDTKY